MTSFYEINLEGLKTTETMENYLAVSTDRPLNSTEDWGGGGANGRRTFQQASELPTFLLGHRITSLRLTRFDFKLENVGQGESRAQVEEELMSVKRPPRKVERQQVTMSEGAC